MSQLLKSLPCKGEDLCSGVWNSHEKPGIMTDTIIPVVVRWGIGNRCIPGWNQLLYRWLLEWVSNDQRSYLKGKVSTRRIIPETVFWTSSSHLYIFTPHIYTQIYSHTHTHRHTHAQEPHLNTHKYLPLHMHIHTYVPPHTREPHLHTHTYLPIHTHAHTCMHIHMHPHKPHLYIHTYLLPPPRHMPFRSQEWCYTLVTKGYNCWFIWSQPGFHRSRPGYMASPWQGEGREKETERKEGKKDSKTWQYS